jgi:hypothetical protein
MEAGVANPTGGVSVAKSTLMLPIKPESTKDAAARIALATQIGNGIMVPYVRVGDFDIEVEWTVKNLDPMPGKIKIELNGANEYWTWDPSTIPTGREQPPMPGLQGDIPIDVPASGQIQGVFREDQLLEASIDLDQITRGNINAFAATLTVNKNLPSFQPLSHLLPPPIGSNTPPPQMPMGSAIPRAAFAQMIRVDLVFSPDHHMTMDYTVRVRDHRGIVNPEGLTAPTTCPANDPQNCQMVFMPVLYK